jgi:hypothetical protein
VFEVLVPIHNDFVLVLEQRVWCLRASGVDGIGQENPGLRLQDAYKINSFDELSVLILLVRGRSIDRNCLTWPWTAFVRPVFRGAHPSPASCGSPPLQGGQTDVDFGGLMAATTKATPTHPTAATSDEIPVFWYRFLDAPPAVPSTESPFSRGLPSGSEARS